MIERILTPPAHSFFLLGPRGTGKSTWLRKLFPDAHWIDLLSEELYQNLLANPAIFSGQLRALPAESWVVVDEIQRLNLTVCTATRVGDKRIFPFNLLV